MDGNYAAAHAWWAYWHLFLVGQGWAEDPAAAMHVAEQLAERAVALDPEDARALTLAGHVRAFLHRRVDDALALQVVVFDDEHEGHAEMLPRRKGCGASYFERGLLSERFGASLTDLSRAARCEPQRSGGGSESPTRETSASGVRCGTSGVKETQAQKKPPTRQHA